MQADVDQLKSTVLPLACVRGALLYLLIYRQHRSLPAGFIPGPGLTYKVENGDPPICPAVSDPACLTLRMSFLQFPYNTFATRWRKRSQNRLMSTTRDGVDPSHSGVPGRFLIALAVAVAAMAPATFAQAITPLDTLVANHGSVSAGAVTFGGFQKPRILPSPLAPVDEFGDIGVSAIANADGTVSLVFTAIDPATGSPSPLAVSSAGAADLIRFVSYSITVNDPNLRLHSVDQKFGPGTAITGNNSAVNGLYTSEPPANVYDLLIFDQIDQGASTVLRGANMPSADGSGSFSGSGGILLPGGNLAGYTMANEFGLIKGHWSFPPGGTLDSLTVTFSLVPAGTPVAPVTVSLAQNGFTVDASGLAGIALSNFAQQGGAVVALSSSNPAVLPVPSTVTVGQGYYYSGPFLIGPSNVDVPTAVTLSASFNGVTQSVPFTAVPATPLSLTGLTVDLLPPNTIRLLVNMSRTNTSPATILLTSSNPAVAPFLQASRYPH